MLLDVRPLQGPSAMRGIGTYVRGLLGGLLEEGYGERLELLVDSALAPPELPAELPLQSVRRRYHGRAAAYEEAVVLGSDLDRIRPGLFHATSLSLPGSRRCALVVTLHDLIPWVFGGWRMAGERVRYWPAKRLLRRADRVLAVSDATRRDGLAVAGLEEARLTVIPEAAAAVFAPRPDAAERVASRYGLSGGYLIYVGALDARKDPRALLAAWEAARAEAPGLELVIAGDAGPQAPASMAGARRLGYVSDEDLADLLNAASCLLFPSRYEGFGLPVLEAMRCGCPVACFRNSSLPQVAGQAAAMVADGDALALGTAAAEFARNPGRRQEARQAGLRQAAGFSWRRAARETIAVYSDLLR